MLSILFLILLFSLVGRLILLSVKAAWGISKILIWIVFLPAAFLLIALSGFLQIAFFLLILFGIASLVGKIV